MSVTKILVDGSSLLFRAWHAMPGLTTPDGTPSGAVRGFVNMLDMLAKSYPEAQIMMVFDASGPTFRHEKYAQYKANRPPMPDDLRVQIEPIHNIVKARGIPLLLKQGLEADDIIASLAAAASAAGEDALILSQDKDLAQCVDEHVRLLRGVGEEPMDRAAVLEKFGIAPERMTDWLALCGDKSDNIPGVSGVGPKKAVKLLEEYGDLDGIVAATPGMLGTDGDRLRKALDELPLYHYLVTVRADVPLDEFVTGQQAADEQELARLYAELGFIEADTVAAGAAPAAEVELLEELEQVLDWLKKAWEHAPVALFFAPEHPGRSHSPTVGLGLADASRRRAFLPVGSRQRQQAEGGVAERISAELASRAGQWLLPDARIGWQRALDMGLALPPGADDPQLRSYMLNPTAGRHELEPLGRQYGMPVRPWDEVAGKGASQTRFSQLSLEDAAMLAGDRADIAVRLEERLRPKLAEQPALDKLYSELELPLTRVLAAMEATGVLINADLLYSQTRELEAQMQELRDRSWQAAGSEFNLSSPAQIGAVLFERLKLPVLSKTSGGKPSTAEGVLERLAADGAELPRLLLEYRGLHKLVSTYTSKLPEEINPRTGRVHTSYRQMVVATGRLSSSDPNLQNIPIRTAEGRRVRAAFEASEGCRLLAADYSQIELRVMAHLSQDAGLVAAFKEGRDVHAATAKELFGSADAEGRRRAKAVNFGLIYGMSAFGLARQLQVPQPEARQYMDTYFERFPQVLLFMDQTRKQAAEQGYVETLWGRRLYLPDIRAGNAARRQAAERAAINAPMQGTAADIIKKAMLLVQDWLTGGDADLRQSLGPSNRRRGDLLMQVHDELVIEMPEDALAEGADEIGERMRQAADLAVPLEVDIGIGDNWEDAKAES